jgi:hypothetical protein
MPLLSRLVRSNRSAIRPRIRRGRLLSSNVATVLLLSSTVVGVSIAAAPPASAAAFTPGNLVVLRVGDGSASLSGVATAAFLDEFTPTGGSAVQSLALPTAPAGANKPLTVSGSATSEGAVSLSSNGSYLTVGGYAAPPGTSGIAATTSAAQPRVMGRIDGAGNIETSTALTTAHSGNNVRGVASTDGASYWSAGGAGGIQYSTLAATTSVQVTTTTNVRVPVLAGGDLYFSTGSGTAGVYRVGPPPVGAPAVAPTLVVSSSSPYGFAVLDRSTAVPGIDAIYVVDDTVTTGGIFKWAFNGSTWTSVGRIAAPTGVQLRGLAVRPSGSGFDLFVTSPSSLYSVSDTSAYDQAPSALTVPATALATAATNTAFRGVAFSPGAITGTAPTISTQPADAPAVVGSSVTLSVGATGTAPLTYQWYQGTAPSTTTPVGTNAASFTPPNFTTAGLVPFWVRVSNTSPLSPNR